MANNNTARKPVAAAAPVQAAPIATAAPVQAAPAAAPTVTSVAAGALVQLGTPWVVRPATHRAYAQAQFAWLQKHNPKGFTLAQAREALVLNSAGAPTIASPKGGWQKHNMPTWALAQGWLQPFGTKAKA